MAWQLAQSGLRHGLQSEVLQRAAQHQNAAETAQHRVQQCLAQQPLFSSLEPTQFEQIALQVKAFAFAQQLVVIGTGGASLGAQALCALSANPQRVVFLENCDPHSMARVFDAALRVPTAWLIVSKSGETVETLAASLALEAWFAAREMPMAQAVCVITSAGVRPLRLWADAHRISTLEHPATLGGRFSVFSVVGLLPAAFAGLDVQKIYSAMQHAAAHEDASELEAASIFAASLPTQPVHVVMGYADCLRPYTQWYKQLWAESLGKGGHGPTPMTAIGAIDQHSQLQLFLDGPRDKLFTVIVPEASGTPLALAATSIAGMEYLSGHSMQNVMHETAEATVATLSEHGVPLRVLRGALTPESLAALMVRTMRETLFVAAFLGVDPYSQPAVESGKARTRAALAQGHESKRRNHG